MATPDPPPPRNDDSARLRVLLAEGAVVVRRGLALALIEDPRVRLVAAPRTAAEANRLIPKRLPDVVVVGTSLAAGTPVQVVAQLHRRFPKVGIVLVTARQSDDELFGAIQAGAAAYLDLDVDLATLRTTLRRVAAGEPVINDQLFDRPNAAEWVRSRFRRPESLVPPGYAGTAVLTEREREVLGLLAEGLTVEQIAERLDVSRPTARYHLRSIIRKLAHDADEERDDPPGTYDPPGADRPDPPQGSPPTAGVPARLRGPKPSSGGHHAALPGGEGAQ